MLKLDQGQIWKQGEDFLRVVEWSRPAIGYKIRKESATEEGPLCRVTKKEFCRLIKGATLQQPEKPEQPVA